MDERRGRGGPGPVPTWMEIQGLSEESLRAAVTGLGIEILGALCARAEPATVRVQLCSLSARKFTYTMYAELCRYMESCRAGRASERTVVPGPGRTGNETRGLAAVLRMKVEDSDSVDPQEEGRDPETGDGRQRKLVRTFHCTSCSCSFTTKAALKMHTNSHQPVSPNKKHKCSHCSFRTDHKENLMNHAHVCSAVKLYTCGVCGERFSESQNVQKHMQVHTTERPYKCKVCKNTFSKLSNLKRHTLIHTTNKPFICGVCGKGFRSSSYCHMQDSHGRAPVHTCTM